MNLSNLTRFGMNSGFCHKTHENNILKGYYAVSKVNSLATSQDKLSVPSQEDHWKLDHEFVLRRHWGITTTRCIITQNSEIRLHKFVCYPIPLHQTKVTNIYIIYVYLFPSNYIRKWHCHSFRGLHKKWVRISTTLYPFISFPQIIVISRPDKFRSVYCFL